MTSLIGELIDMGDRTSSDGTALDGITVKYGQFYYSTIEHAPAVANSVLDRKKVPRYQSP